MEGVRDEPLLLRCEIEIDRFEKVAAMSIVFDYVNGVYLYNKIAMQR